MCFLSLPKSKETLQLPSHEQLWIDVVCVHPWVHKWILHGILSGFKRPSQQKSYPNTAQKLAHYWCCQPVMVRAALVIALLLNLLKMAWL
jgi:hypothetical protein